MTERLIRRPDVEAMTGLSRSSIYAMIASGNFPKSVKIGDRAVAWPQSVIQEWITARIAGVESGKGK